MNTLNKLNAWSKTNEYHSFKSAQGYMGYQNACHTSVSCGSSCGTGGDKLVKIGGGGSSCGTGDDK